MTDEEKRELEEFAGIAYRAMGGPRYAGACFVGGPREPDLYVMRDDEDPGGPPKVYWKEKG